MTKLATLTEAERAEKRAADREYARQAVEALRTSEGWRRWLTTRASFHRYSLANQLLIAMQRPTAVRVAGFKKWLSLGYCVQKGEKAIRIWAPCPPSKKKIQAWKDAGANPDERPRTFFRLTSVFGDDQVAELPPPGAGGCFAGRATATRACKSPRTDCKQAPRRVRQRRKAGPPTRR